MFRSFCVSVILSMMVVGGVWAQPIVGRGGPRAARPPGVRPRQDAVIERWSRMTPEERRKVLERLPPERRQKIEEQLNRYQSLSPDEREQLRFRTELFNRMPLDNQDIARRVFRQFSQLPPDRQSLLREEFQSLRAMPPEGRRARVQSDEFREQYTDREQMFLRQLLRLLNQVPL